MTNAALVTGGSRGIGLGIVKHLAAAGYQVAINGVRPETEVTDILDGLKDNAATAVYVRGDIGDPDDRQSIVQSTLDAFGHIDVLVNNAGISSPGRLDILDATEQSFDQVMRVNVKGPYFLTQEVARQMVVQKNSEPEFRGVIINITSISATVATTNRGDYCMSKAALSMSTKLWATRLAEFGIDVFEVRPGIIATDMTSTVTEKYDRLIAGGLTLQRRWGDPSDIGIVVAALVRGNVPYATGQILTIDGGLTLPRL